jgi:hypothetical protein
MRSDSEFMAQFDRLDAFLDGSVAGERPIDLLLAQGMTLPDDASLDDAALGAKLWEVVEGAASLGVYLDSTDHLSDRELYRWLTTDALCQEMLLDGCGMTVTSPIGGCSEEDNEIYLRYYADDEDRAMWRSDLSDPLPDRAPLPFDRDRLLPGRREEP